MGFDSKSLPNSLRKCIAPEERAQSVALQTHEEASEKFAVKAEKEMHRVFENWCRVNDLFVIHSRTDRKTTTRCGLPDFFVIKGDADALLFHRHQSAKVCAVEFKFGNNKLRPEQIKVLDDLIAKGIPTTVALGVSQAIAWTKEQLEK